MPQKGHKGLPGIKLLKSSVLWLCQKNEIIDIFFKLRWLWVSFIFHKSYKIWRANPSKLPYDVFDPLKMGDIYPSSYKHRSEKWVPPKIVCLSIVAIFLTEPWLWMIMGERVMTPLFIMGSGEVPSPASAGSAASFPSVLVSASGFCFSTSVLLGKDQGGRRESYIMLMEEIPAPGDIANISAF